MVRLKALASTLGLALETRATRRALAAYFGFSIAEWGIWVSILVYAYNASGPLAVGIAAFAQLVPTALLGHQATVRISRIAGSRSITSSYLLQLTLFGALAAIMALNAALPMVIVVGAAANVIVATARPFHYASLAVWAHSPGALVASNVATSVTETWTAFIGPALAGLVMSVAGPAAAVAALLVALASAAAIAPAGATPQEVPSPEVAEDPVGRRIWPAMGVISVIDFIAGGVEVLAVVVAIQVLGIGDGGAGYLMSLIGVGAVIGAGFAASMIGRERLSNRTVGALLIMGIGLLVFGVVPSLTPILVLVGAGMPLAEIGSRSLIQRLLPEASLKSAFGALESLSAGSVAAGAITVPAVIERWGADTATLMLATIAGLGALVLAPGLARAGLRSRVPHRELRVLAETGLFGSLDAAEQERIASHATIDEFRPGTEVIAEGDTGTSVWFITRGTVRVFTADRELATLRPGDFVGEMALLLGSRRTASAVALDHTTAVRFDDAWVDVLSIGSAARSKIEEVARARHAERYGTG